MMMHSKAYMHIGADALQEDNAVWGGLIAIHVLPRHFNVYQALLLHITRHVKERSFDVYLKSQRPPLSRRTILVPVLPTATSVVHMSLAMASSCCVTKMNRLSSFSQHSTAQHSTAQHSTARRVGQWTCSALGDHRLNTDLYVQMTEQFLPCPEQMNMKLASKY